MVQDDHLILPDQSRVPLTHLGLPGHHQKHNASLALMTLWVLGKLPSFDQIQTALSTTNWPGRFQNLHHPILAPHHQWWIDGAHNLDGAQSVQQVIQTWDSPLLLIFAMKKDKDPHLFLPHLLPFVQKIFLIDLGEGFWPPASLRSIIQSLNATMNVQEETLIRVVRQINSIDRPHSILATGSLYLVGHVLTLLEEQ